MALPASLRLRKALENLLTDSAPPECPNAHECFSDGQWGWLAFDDPESNMCGGRPWMECFCASDAQRQAADALMGKG